MQVQRDGVIEVTRADGDKTPAVVRMTVSSETPCLCVRFWNDQYQRVVEILDHSETSIDRSRMADGLVIRDQHYGDQIGLIAAPEIKGGKLGGAVEFCSGERAQELRQDCEKKLRRNVSVEGLVDPSSYRLEGEQDGAPLVRAMRWTPLAAALVAAAPADPKVGVGRTITPPNVITHKETPPMAEDTQTAKPDPVAARNAEVSEIFVLARQQNIDPDCTAEVIRRGITPQAFGMEILAGKAAKLQPKTVTPGTLGEVLTPKEVRKFSLHRAIDAFVNHENAFEREVSTEIAARMGKPPQGFYMPNEIARTMSVVGANGDGALVATELLAGSFIDMLRAQVAIDRLGVTRLLGMVGDVTIPKQLTGQTYYHVGRDAAVTASDATFGLVKASPHTIGARTIVGRSMLKQSSLNAEALTQRNIVKAMASGMDICAFAGVGGSEPIGLRLATNLNAATVTTPGSCTWANILTFLSTIAADNVALQNMKWTMPTNVLFNLAGIQKVSGEAVMLATETAGNWTIAGYPVVLSNNVPAKSAFFGAWDQFYWVMWGAVDIAVNPYTYDNQGAVAITALQDYDHLVANAEAFSYNGAVIS